MPSTIITLVILLKSYRNQILQHLLLENEKSPLSHFCVTLGSMNHWACCDRLPLHVSQEENSREIFEKYCIHGAFRTANYFPYVTIKLLQPWVLKARLRHKESVSFVLATESSQQVAAAIGHWSLSILDHRAPDQSNQKKDTRSLLCHLGK